MTIIRVLQHDASNSLSVIAALKSVGLPCSHILVQELDQISYNSWLIIPGVGHMKSLSGAVDSYFGIDRLRLLVIEKNLSILGICLGFQFLCLTSAEDPQSKTLGLINLHVERISTPPTPTVGWYQLEKDVPSRIMFNNCDPTIQLTSSEYYFTHSYAALLPCNNSDDTINVDTYYYLNQSGQKVVGAVLSGKLVGLQFHPEKSGANGLQLLHSILTASVV